MMAKCRYKNCPEEGYTWMSGCCCPRHQAAYQRSLTPRNGKQSNTSMSILGRPALNRRNGTDNRTTNGE